ncbi:Protein F07A11.1 [Aphelenchoides avenae]|nr:Protein F07A11.1 [Aphelenchus avenae]KAH7726361.1 Protein F07A11.1 [Aphelenchus avenae]
MGGISAPLPPIISPLDDLKTFPESTDAEFDKLARELARIDLDKDKVPDVIRDDHHVRTTDDGVTRITHHRVTEDVELCEHCLMEEKAFRDAQEAALLKKKIGQHVDDVNLQFAKRKKHEDLLPMNTLPPFVDRNGADREREMQAKLKYRRELEDEIERRRQAALYREEREKQMHNYSNTRDAHAFAEDRQQRQRLEQEERKRNDESLRQQIELRNLVRREEEERLEWWERRPQRGAVVVERDKDHLMGQLRRNEALQHSVEMLEKFKRDRQEYEGMAKDAQRRQFDNLRDKISEQSALTRWQEPRRGSLDGGAAAAGLDPATQEAVYRAWQEAHLRNDKRYRVLQDIDAQRNQRQIETDIELKRCRRCHRPMHASRRVRIRDIAQPAVQSDTLQGPLEMFSPNI